MDDIDLTVGREIVIAQVEPAQLDGNPVNIVKRLTDINPPCVYVSLNTIETWNFGGTVGYNVDLIAPNTDDDASVVQLQALLEAVLPLVSPAGPITYIGLQVPEHQQPLPTLRIPIEI